MIKINIRDIKENKIDISNLTLNINQVKEIIGSENENKFLEYMKGQTGIIEKNEKGEDECKFFGDDVRRFILGLKVID